MNKYKELKNKIEKEINNFPMFFAFNPRQFTKGLEKFRLTRKDTSQLLKIGGGGFIKKSDSIAFEKMLESHNTLRQDSLKDDEYVYSAMLYELFNHEYCYTGCPVAAFEAIGLSLEEVKADERLLRIFNETRIKYFEEMDGEF